MKKSINKACNPFIGEHLRKQQGQPLPPREVMRRLFNIPLMPEPISRETKACRTTQNDTNPTEE